MKVKYLSDEIFFLESYKDNSNRFFWGNNSYNFLSSIEVRLIVPKVFHNEIWILIHFNFLFPVYVYVCVSCLVVSNSATPWTTCNLPGSSVHGILQVRILEWVAFPSPGGLPDPGIEPGSPTLQADSLPSEL